MKLNELINSWFQGKKTKVAIPIMQLESDLETLVSKNVHILRGVEFVSSKKSDAPIQIKGIAELSRIFTKAQVIIGADGARSDIRNEMSGDAGSEELLQNTLLVKVLSKKKPSEQNIISRTFTMGKCGRAIHEHVGEKNEDGLFSITAQMVIDEKEYAAVEHGSFKHPLTLDELTHPNLKKSISLWLQNRVKGYRSLKIIPVPLKTYLAPKLASKNVGEPVVVLTGDAAGSMPYFKAVNKGIEGSLELGKALSAYFKTKKTHSRYVRTLSKPFKEYEIRVRALLERAIQESEFKAAKIALGDSSIASSGKLLDMSGFNVAGRTQNTWDVVDKVARFGSALVHGVRALLPF